MQIKGNKIVEVISEAPTEINTNVMRKLGIEFYEHARVYVEAELTENGELDFYVKYKQGSGYKDTAFTR